MAGQVPNVLILGRSFVKRLQRDMLSNSDARVDANFKLQGSALVHLHGICRRTVAKLRSFDLHVVTSISPDVVILEIGTNDLSLEPPEVVGSAIEELVRLLLDSFSVRVVGVCHVIPRGISEMSHIPASFFAQRAQILNHYVSVILDDIPNAFCWRHRNFSHPAKGRCTRYDFVACDNGLRQAHDMICDCCVRQKKCRSILKHVLKRCDNRKSCRRPVVSLSHATKSYRVNRP